MSHPFDQIAPTLSLGSDNHSGVHPRVMEALIKANRGHAHAYGGDEISALTRKEFRRVFGTHIVAEFVFNGTAANILGLAPLLSRFEAVICASTAHLNLDEGGAPEKFLGAKLWTVPSDDGKITPAQIAPLLERRGDQHYAQPRIVSLTLPTELGVTYSLEELRDWSKFVRERSLMLQIDGARLANAAAFLGVSLSDILGAANPDVVAFGGAKNGLMGAEAILRRRDSAPDGFKFHRKQAMQLSSKTRFLAAQFYGYLHEDLWLEIARHTTSSARRLAAALAREFPEIKLAYPVESNALFVYLPEAWIKPLRQRFFFYIWHRGAGLCRWMISWDWTLRDHAKVLLDLAAVRDLKPIA